MTFHRVEFRDLPDQQVVVLQGVVNAFELPAFLQNALTRLVAHAESHHTEITGAPFVLYHEPVNETDSGAVEVCLPVEGNLPRHEGFQVRLDLAHREMYTTLSFEQVQGGNLMAAYEKLRTLMPGRGLQPAGSPREVYFNFSASPAADEAFLDIAYAVVPQGCCGGSLTCAGPVQSSC